MDRRFSPRLAPWGALLLLAALGCSKSDQTPTASVNGPSLGNAQGGSTAAGASGTTANSGKVRRPAAVNPYPQVLIETSLGSFTLKLDRTKAPQTVDNFLSYVQEGYYKGTVFHHVAKDYAVVAGTYDVQGQARKTRTPIRNEARTGLKNARGVVAMARQPDAVDSATSGFIINLRDNPLLDHKDDSLQGYGYCGFGEVVSGQEVLEKIAAVPVRENPFSEQSPTTPILITAARQLPDPPQ